MTYSASRGNRSSVTLVSCRQIRSGAASAAKRARWSRRWRNELTFQVASRMPMTPILARKLNFVETRPAPAIYRTDLALNSCWYALCATIVGNRGKPSGESRLRKSIDSASECNLRPARTFTSTFAIHCSHWQWRPNGGP